MEWKKIINNVVITIISTGCIGVLAYTFGFIKKSFPLEFLPKNAIVAFNSDCPQEGWEEYKLAKGRFILGAGQGALYNGNLLTKRSLGDIGGQEKYMLVKDQLPRHNHDAGTLTIDEGTLKIHESSDGNEKSSNYRKGGLFNYQEYSYNYGDHIHKVTGQTDFTGDNREYEIMPPYITLTFCKKL